MLRRSVTCMFVCLLCVMWFLNTMWFNSIIFLVNPVQSGLGSAMLPTESQKQESAGTKTGGCTPLAPKNVKDLLENPGYTNVDIFTYEEMRLATKQFRPDYILGEGGFGVVYKGVIDENVRPGYKTTQVAIKELNREGFQGDREWLVVPFSCTL